MLSFRYFCFNNIYSLSVNVWRQFPIDSPIGITMGVSCRVVCNSLSKQEYLAQLLPQLPQLLPQLPQLLISLASPAKKDQ